MRKGRRQFLKTLGAASILAASESHLFCSDFYDPANGPRDVFDSRSPLKGKRIGRNEVDQYFSSYNLYWGDLHAHTGYSDGYGKPHEFFKRAKYQQNLDFAAASDHGEWMKAFEEAFPSAGTSSPDIWQRYCRSVENHNIAGLFVTILGVEWSGGQAGHRNIYFRGFDNIPPYPPINAKTYPTPVDFWSFLDDHTVESLTIPHHTTLETALTDWSRTHKSERLVEIYSEWGCSEDFQSDYEPLHVYKVHPHLKKVNKAHFVNSVLATGRKLGIIAGTDNHHGLAGSAANDRPRGISLSASLGFGPRMTPQQFKEFISCLKANNIDSFDRYLNIMGMGYTMDRRTSNRCEVWESGGGLAAVFATSLSNDAIWSALWDRRAYGTTGPRPEVKFLVRNSLNTSEFALLGGEIDFIGLPQILLTVAGLDAGTTLKAIQIFRNGTLCAYRTYSPGVIDASLSITDLQPRNQTDSYRARIILTETINHDGDGLVQDQLEEVVWTSPVWVSLP